MKPEIEKDVGNKQKAAIEFMRKAEKAFEEQNQEGKDEDQSIKHDSLEGEEWGSSFSFDPSTIQKKPSRVEDVDRATAGMKEEQKNRVMETEPPRVVIQGIDIPIWDMVGLILKWFVASLIASALIAVIVVVPILIVLQAVLH